MEVVAFADRFWLMAGRDDKTSDPPEKGTPQSTTYNDVWTFSPDTQTWRQITGHAPWSPRMWSAAAVYRDRIWLVGGYDSVHHKNLGDVWYTKDGSDWHQLKTENQWQERHKPTLYVFKGSLWLVAGNTWPVQNDVWKLELVDANKEFR